MNGFEKCFGAWKCVKAYCQEDKARGCFGLGRVSDKLFQPKVGLPPHRATPMVPLANTPETSTASR